MRQKPSEIFLRPHRIKMRAMRASGAEPWGPRKTSIPLNYLEVNLFNLTPQLLQLLMKKNVVDYIKTRKWKVKL